MDKIQAQIFENAFICCIYRKSIYMNRKNAFIVTAVSRSAMVIKMANNSTNVMLAASIFWAASASTKELYGKNTLMGNKLIANCP